MFTVNVNKMLFDLAHEQCKKRRITRVSYAVQFGAEYKRAKQAYMLCVYDVQQSKINKIKKVFSVKLSLMSLSLLFS